MLFGLLTTRGKSLWNKAIVCNHPTSANDLSEKAHGLRTEQYFQ